MKALKRCTAGVTVLSGSTWPGASKVNDGGRENVMHFDMDSAPDKIGRGKPFRELRPYWTEQIRRGLPTALAFPKRCEALCRS